MQNSITVKRLREVLDEYDMRPVDLARVTGINRSSISRYLSGSYKPSHTAINKIAIALGVSEMWLWGYDVPKLRYILQQEDNEMYEIIVRMRKDDSFSNTVKELHKLPADDFDTISRLLHSIKK